MNPKYLVVTERTRVGAITIETRSTYALTVESVEHSVLVPKPEPVQFESATCQSKMLYLDETEGDVNKPKGGFRVSDIDGLIGGKIGVPVAIVNDNFFLYYRENQGQSIPINHLASRLAGFTIRGTAFACHVDDFAKVA